MKLVKECTAHILYPRYFPQENCSWCSFIVILIFAQFSSPWWLVGKHRPSLPICRSGAIWTVFRSALIHKCHIVDMCEGIPINTLTRHLQAQNSRIYLSINGTSETKTNDFCAPPQGKARLGLVISFNSSNSHEAIAACNYCFSVPRGLQWKHLQTIGQMVVIVCEPLHCSSWKTAWEQALAYPGWLKL